MKISPSGLSSQAPIAAIGTQPAAPATTPPPAIEAPEERQSAVLESAQAALRASPEIDEARVAALRDALARGEVRFDAGKLAGLIQRYHSGGGE